MPCATIMVASAVTAPPLARASRGALELRVVSALVIVPPVLAAIWFDGLWLDTLIVLAAAGMGWEWARLCRVGWASVAGVLIVATTASAAAGAAAGRPAAALALALVGAAVVFVAARRRGVATALWAAAGTLWVAVPCVAFLWVRADSRTGLATALWLLAVVWASDIGAFAVGRAVGGPKLAPRLSPNKTWAGFVGGLGGAAAAGAAAAAWSGAALGVTVPVSLCLGVVAQIGDLVESLAKRRFGVKDSGGLIPGHGGLLDRLDSLLTATAAQALMMVISGSSPLSWRESAWAWISGGG